MCSFALLPFVAYYSSVASASPTSWNVLPSANLDVHGKCGCVDATCHDLPGFHYAGKLLNDSACASTCESAGTSNCSMWFRSAHSSHCWWKLGTVWDPVKMSGITAGCLSNAVPGCGTFPGAPPTPPPTPLPEIISGQGKFRYRYEPSKLRLPASVKLLNGHGVAKDKAGNIYFTYESEDKTDPSVRALIRFAPDGTGGTLLGNSTLAQGVPHGLKVQEEEVEYLYHANNAATITKTTLAGDIVWRTDMTAAWSHDKAHWPFKPTDLLVAPGDPNSTSLLVADGYGLSQVHEFDRRTGKYTGKVYGGKGAAAKPGAPATFECNHGLSLDDRLPGGGKIVVSDRSNHRLVWIENDGTIIKTLGVASAEPLPCNAQTSAGSAALGGGYLVVPGLGVDHADPGPYLNGSVSIYDESNALVSTVEVARYLGVGVLGHTHPHDAIFLENGDLVVAVWKGHEAGSFGGIEYWTLLK